MNQKSDSDVVEHEKRENLNFVYPSLAKSLFLSSYGGQDRGPMRAMSEFYSDQN